jgi:hypothetical protein
MPCLLSASLARAYSNAFGANLQLVQRTEGLQMCKQRAQVHRTLVLRHSARHSLQKLESDSS